MKRLFLGLLAVAVVLRWASAGSVDRASADDFGSLVALVLAIVAWAAYGWLALAVVVTALERVPGAFGRAAARATAAIMSPGTRVLVRSALGVAATAPLTVAAAQAHTVQGDTSITRPATSWDPRTGVERDSTVPGSDDVSVRETRTGPNGERRLPVPDRPTTGAATRYTPVRPADTVVVRPGDSLWTIAARELGPQAPRTAIDRRWPQWYAANADRIGPDPALIRPGQHLVRPTDVPSDQEK